MTNLLELGAAGINGVAFDPDALIPELIAYGETEVAEMMQCIGKDQHLAISGMALEVLLRESCTVDKAICLAAWPCCMGNPAR